VEELFGAKIGDWQEASDKMPVGSIFSQPHHQ